MERQPEQLPCTESTDEAVDTSSSKYVARSTMVLESLVSTALNTVSSAALQSVNCDRVGAGDGGIVGVALGLKVGGSVGGKVGLAVGA